MSDSQEDHRLKRWRLVLGSEAESATTQEMVDQAMAGLDVALDSDEQQIDQVLQALYDSDRKAGLGSSCPKVNRWLGDIRKYFSTENVRMLQKDALDRLKLHQMLMQPETLEQIEPDIHLAATLLTLKSVIPEKTKATARMVVRKVVEDFERRLRQPLTEAVQGALSKVMRSTRPRPHEIDWHRTIRKNMRNYLPELQTIIPEKLVGYGKRRSSLRDVILCVDQSGSMATSVVYSSLFAAVLASIRAVQTRLIVFDTEVVDLSDLLTDPVDVLFGAQLGGGTDINQAVGYAQQFVERPEKTIFILISDLYEGGDTAQLMQRLTRLSAAGVTVISLLALNDEGTPAFSERNAEILAELGVPCFGCTPELFPELMSAAIQKQDLPGWAAKHDIVVRGRDYESEFDERNPSNETDSQ